MKIVDIYARVVERTRTLLDRISHTGQRTRAGARLGIRGRPSRVVIVCYGNICRSPYAAAALREQLAAAGGTEIDVDSAGLIGPNRPANDQASAIALQRGCDLSGHRSRLLRPADSTHADLFLVMTHHQRTQLVSDFGVEENRIELLADFDVEDPPCREIGDPYGRSDDEFRRVFDQIDRSVCGLTAIWANQIET